MRNEDNEAKLMDLSVHKPQQEHLNQKPNNLVKEMESLHKSQVTIDDKAKLEGADFDPIQERVPKVIENNELSEQIQVFLSFLSFFLFKKMESLQFFFGGIFFL